VEASVGVGGGEGGWGWRREREGGKCVVCSMYVSRS
jgi:hypothetical protein